MSETCANCGAGIPDGSGSCPSCGSPADLAGQAGTMPQEGPAATPTPGDQAAQAEYEARYADYEAQRAAYEREQYEAQQAAYAQQQYAAQNAAYQAQQQAPAQTPPKKKTGMVIAIGLVAALLACGACAFVGLFVIGSDSGRDYGAWEASRDQQRVVAEFGYPQSFAIYYGADPVDAAGPEGGQPVHRVEVWDYYDLNSRFTFKDGVATGVYDAPSLPTGAEAVTASPLDFSMGMSIDDVANVLGTAPDTAFDIAPDAGENLELYGFYGQVVAGFDDGALMAIETVPMVAEGGEQ